MKEIKEIQESKLIQQIQEIKGIYNEGNQESCTLPSTGCPVSQGPKVCLSRFIGTLNFWVPRKRDTEIFLYSETNQLSLSRFIGTHFSTSCEITIFPLEHPLSRLDKFNKFAIWIPTQSV